MTARLSLSLFLNVLRTPSPRTPFSSCCRRRSDRHRSGCVPGGSRQRSSTWRSHLEWNGFGGEFFYLASNQRAHLRTPRAATDGTPRSGTPDSTAGRSRRSGRCSWSSEPPGWRRTRRYTRNGPAGRQRPRCPSGAKIKSKVLQKRTKSISGCDPYGNKQGLLGGDGRVLGVLRCAGRRAGATLGEHTGRRMVWRGERAQLEV